MSGDKDRNIHRKFKGKGQAERLIKQHEKSGGVDGIFGDSARAIDSSAAEVTQEICKYLTANYRDYEFRIKKSLSKSEINRKLKDYHFEFGNTLFVKESEIKPDGGILEVLVDRERDIWKVILVIESKTSGK